MREEIVAPELVDRMLCETCGDWWPVARKGDSSARWTENHKKFPGHKVEFSPGVTPDYSEEAE